MTAGDILLVIKGLVALVEQIYADQKLDAEAIRSKFDSVVTSFRKPDFTAEDAKVDAALAPKQGA